MSGKLAWGWYPTGKVWLPIVVDSSGRLKVDMSNIDLGDLGNVDLTGLADDDFLYYDLASGLWKPRKLVDADIPATIARDAEVVAAIGDHADLKTGIHGVGARKVAETSVEDLDLAAHKTRHEFLGGDELDLLGLLAEKVLFFGDWRTKDQIIDYTTDSGAVDWDGIIQTTLRTGVTNGSHAAEYSNYSGLWRPCYAGHHTMMQIEGDGIVNDACTIRFYLQCTLGASTPPADTDRHVGWKVKNKRIWATVADGTTETEVDTGVDIGGTFTNYKLHTVGDYPNNVKFYIDGVLVATISTNLYTNSTHRFWCGIVNTAAKDQRIRCDYCCYLS